MSWPAVGRLLPHEPPMVLLDDEVLAFDGETARCGVTLGEGSMFVEGSPGVVPAVVALEYMAQCVGVCTSLRALEQGDPTGAGGGILVGVRELRLEVGRFAVGDQLEVEATLTVDGQQLGSFACRVTRSGRTAAIGTLNVYRHPAADRKGER